MNQNAIDPLETRLAQVARQMIYPPTPDIAAGWKVVKPRTAFFWRPAHLYIASIALVILLLASLLSVPGVRAAVLEFLRIGAVRIFLQQPDAQPLSAETPQEPTTASTPIYLASILDLGGETTLERARELSGLPVLLPAYPASLGAPDRVFLQDLGGYMVVLAWSDPEHPERARMSLHVITPGSFTLTKIQPETIETTRVNGHEAIWAVGPYPLEMKNGAIEFGRTVDGNVLIWTEGDITYRLESDLTMNEAIRIAESLR
jgi:hypothetical protein